MLKRTAILSLAALGCLIMADRGAFAQLLMDDLPANARGIDVEDKVGEFIPLDLIFEDERGNKVGIGKYFNQGKPIVLTLNYSDCPGLCVAQLDNLVGTLREMNADGLGDEYEIVTVSIDPSESAEKAARTKAKYTGLLRDSSSDQAWHFLTGKQREIGRLADAVGFRYTYDRANKRYNHPAATYFLNEEGRVCRYLLSLGVEPSQFKLAVSEAKAGKLSLSVTDSIIQFCYLYDPDANRYSASARRVLALGGAAFCLLLVGMTAPFWFSGRRRPGGDGTVKPSGGPGQGAAKEPSGAIGDQSSEPSSYNNSCYQPDVAAGTPE